MPLITELWAFVTDDSGPGDEGITSFLSPRSGIWMPMVGADAKRMRSLRSMAQSIATGTGKTIKLVRFTGREEIEEIKP